MATPPPISTSSPPFQIYPTSPSLKTHTSGGCFYVSSSLYYTTSMVLQSRLTQKVTCNLTNCLQFCICYKHLNFDQYLIVFFSLLAHVCSHALGRLFENINNHKWFEVFTKRVDVKHFITSVFIFVFSFSNWLLQKQSSGGVLEVP